MDRLGYAALLHANPQAQEMLRRETAEHLNQALFRAFCSALPQEQVGRFIQMACNGAPIAARVAYLLEHVVKLDEVVLSVMLRVQRTHLAMTATPQGRHNQLVYLV
ncbi:MAG TPA: hypothetical protein VK821_12150 [Dehalococcoidia bacterium]|nr:hypothetical protein [Dehalococcoidia bacterium]